MNSLSLGELAAQNSLTLLIIEDPPRQSWDTLLKGLSLKIGDELHSIQEKEKFTEKMSTGVKDHIFKIHFKDLHVFGIEKKKKVSLVYKKQPYQIFSSFVMAEIGLTPSPDNCDLIDCPPPLKKITDYNNLIVINRENPKTYYPWKNLKIPPHSMDLGVIISLKKEGEKED